MIDDPRVDRVLEKLLESGSSPEEACRTCPELLSQVKTGLQRLQRLEQEVSLLFPPCEATEGDASATLPPAELPHIRGYELVGVLGRGGMGVVYQARHLRLDRPVALKMLLAGPYAGPDELERFLREAEAVAGLRHPNIVQVYEVGDVDGRSYFTMELIEGGSLAQMIQGVPPPIRKAAALAATLADAVHVAHQSGIVHRDLKPANILLTADGTPKVTDFGLARRLQGGGALTLSGVPMGTPSYMAPEQAQGKRDTAGPATDVYALGAILYELLTGRPPFRAATSAETLQQVISLEPAPPSRLNDKVPRDLETICLKCLHKEPGRRYPSARDLSEDLRRYLEGKPIRARPVGAVERAVKWAWRRPTAALLIAAFLVMAGAAVGTSLWMHQQEADRRAAKEQRQGQAREAVETALRRAGELMREERWKEAWVVLEDAAPHFAEAYASDLEKTLKQAQADCRVADAIQTARESYPLLPDATLDYKQRAREFLKAFEQAGLSVDGDAETVADQIRSSAIREQLVAALDDRAVVAFMLGDKRLAERFLTIARLADPGSPWRNRFRDSSIWWSDQLQDLAATAFTSSPPPTEHQLALLALLLRSRGAWGGSDQLLGEACRRQPRNFWAQREMGNALAMHHRELEAAGYYRVAVSLRPDNAGAYEGLGNCLSRLGQVEDGIAAYRQAVKASPNSAPIRARLVEALAQAGYWNEAEAECRLALERDRTNYLVPHRLADALARAERAAEALIIARRATEIAPNVPETHVLLGQIYQLLARHEDAVKAFRTAAAVPSNHLHFAELGLAQELAAVGCWEEALVVLRTAADRQPVVAAYPREIGVILRSHGMPEEAARAFQKAATRDAHDPLIWDGLVGSLLDLGRFAEARAAVESSLKLPVVKDAERRGLRRQLDLCDSLLAVEARLSAILAGKERPDEVPTQRALAEWCLKHKRLPATAADLYASAFAARPSLADDPEAGNRSHAARAAALAGCGVGEDATQLDERRRAELRRQALDWLTAEYDVWAERHRVGKPGDRTVVAQAVRSWQRNEDLAGVRGEQALARLLPGERRDWETLWSKVATLSARDPVELVQRAREHVGRQEWGKAVACYAETLELAPTDDGDLWFEYAAAQLLAGDRPGYRRACAHMLSRCQALKMRPYLAARVCTLAADSADDPELPERLSQGELQRSTHEFWSLTEQAALHVRAGRIKEATPLLDVSLRIDGRPARAVLNWLWLALAYQKQGKAAEARGWLDKAANWLDQQGGQMPLDTPLMGTHRHNWLEAHVVRREVEALIQSAENR